MQTQQVILDVLKPTGTIVDLSDSFNARVGDKMTPFQLFILEGGVAKDLKGMHPELEAVVGNGALKGGKAIMNAGAKGVHWVGSTNNVTGYNQLTLAFPAEVFPQSGFCYGHLILANEAGVRESSVDIWFQVLDGTPQMGMVANHYDSELALELAKAKNMNDQFSQEMRAAYSQQVTDAQNALIKATANLNDLAGTAGDMSAQIKANNIITKQQFDNGIASNHAYIDQKFKEMLDKIGDATPHFIDTVNDLKNTHPNGEKGLWVAKDDGNRYVWLNGQWTNFGAYQGQGIKDKYITNRMIADNTIQDNAISTVHLSSIQDSYAYVGEATVWNGQKTDQSVYFDKDNVAWIKKSTEKGDAGILFPVRLPFIPTGGGAAYIDFSYSTLNADGLEDKVDIWITQNDGTLIKQLWMGPKKAGAGKIKISAVDFSQNAYPKDFSLLFAVHGGAGTLDVQVRVSFNSDNIELPIRNYQLGKLISTNHPGTGVWDDESWIDASKVRSSNHNLLNNAILWNGGKYDALNFNNDELVKTSGDLSYNSGIAVPVEVDTTTDQYIKLVYGYHGLGKGVNGISAYLGNEKQALKKNLGSARTADTACTITAHITPEMFNQYGIEDKLYLVVGGMASAMFFKKIQVSSLLIERTLSSALSHLHDEVGEPDEKQYGQSIGGIDKATKVNVDGLAYGTTGVGYDGDNGRLKSIQAYVPAQGTYNFVVGKLDQHNLLVNGTTFTIGLGQGSNNVDMTSRNIQVNNGDIVFMDLSKAGVYNPDGTHPKYLDSFIQDNNHPSTTPGYPGQMFYDANYLVPFSYSVASMNLPQQITELKNELADAKKQLNNNNSKKMNTISTPNGKSYRLVVANDGSLSAVSTIPSSVTIFGNSLTYEHGKIGMAASDANHDWYHYVTDYIKGKNSSVKINDRTNMSIWESAISTADREKIFNDSIKPFLSADTDLVIIQLGDNVNTAEKKATFAHDVGELLQQIHAVSPKAQVYWVYGWFGNYPEIFTPIQNACDNNGATGIDIHDLNKSGNTSYVGATRTGLDGSTWQITNPGEAAHPGDQGMKAIADRVISNFDF
ncbi:SGNH/GDSL hydrolase family protein [Limosilactobacillus sp. RRLNB_1_1]|uniref:SGNH/GDSL hydrolase family protein n=1 Tax=Limosilactobacillus albertensis TaxID=2759752 RepID=A0A7W3Y9N0_9LACO|nr:SGNH/GDSL hydrolase family protein [Limosilactobacillus albertensis]MBB1070677.1 SGNH/GDSL hydrolase family protein [Limosilactobacillus albertensis]MCD7117424.1 hypothetical protein [Limosilactobacillus albertensis]MCD7129191.1 hypothetical protein [Limosilactobacillus albertensis]